MRHSHRTLSALTLLVAVAMFLAACGGSATDTPVPPSATNTPGTPPTNTPVPPTSINASSCASATKGVDLTSVKKITVEDGATLRVSGWGNPSEQQITKDELCRFAVVYPNIKVTYEPSPDAYDTKIKTQLSAGTQPDVFYVDPPLADIAINANKLLELSPYMSQAGVSKTDYFPALINIFSRTDKIYGIPKDFGSIVVFYNTAMVTSTGATAPPVSGNWTWDDYKALATKLTVGTDPNTKVFGTSHPPDYARWLPFALANGATVLSADGKSSAINSKAALDALTWYYGFIKDGTAAEPKTLSSGWPGEAFGKGRIGFAIEGGWMIPYLADPSNGYTGIKYQAAPLPKAPSGKQGDLLFTNAWSASADSKYPKASAALVLFLTGAVNEGAVMHIGFALPTLNSFSNDPYLAQNPTQAVLYNTASYGVADYYGPATANIQKAMSDAMSALFLNKTDPQGALKMMDDGINAALANQ